MHPQVKCEYLTNCIDESESNCATCANNTLRNFKESHYVKNVDNHDALKNGKALIKTLANGGHDGFQYQCSVCSKIIGNSYDTKPMSVPKCPHCGIPIENFN